MKRFLLATFFALSLTAGAIGAASVVHADARDTNNSNVVGGGSGVDDANTTQTYSDAFKSAAQSAAQQTPSDLGKSSDDQYNTIMAKIMTLFAWLVGVAALTLDYAVYYTVVNMGSYVHNLSAVGVTWRILRDLGNIMLIFGFLAIGISIILNTEKLGYGRKMLPMLLVSAVFLNFSLFFAEAIIDTGNLFATQFYTQINGGTAPTAAFLSNLSTKNEGISNKLMAQLGLTQIYGQASNPARAQEIFKQGNPWIIGFMGILLFIVTAFVLFSLAFILIARFVALIFLIILAPIGFAGLAVPQLAHRAQQWWSQLFSQTLTAPVLLLMLYVALAVITDAKFLTGFDSGQNPDWLGSVGNANLIGFGSVLLTFLVAMGLLIAVTIAAKSMSAFGAGWATKTAGSLSFGVSAWAANRTVGRGLYHLSRVARQNKTFNKFDALTGRVGSRVMDRAATGSFDIRGTKLLKNLPGGGIDAGEAAKDGFAGARKRNIEDHEKAIKAIDTAVDDRNLQKTAAAALVRANAEKEHKETTEPVAERIKAQEAEVKRLEDLDNEKRNKGIYDKATKDALTTAKNTLEANRAVLNAENARLKQAVDAEKKVGDNIAADKKSAKLAYASGIDHPINNILNPLNLIAYGPRTGEAAAKIVKATVKKETDFDKLVKAVSEANKHDSGEKKEDKKKEEPKPSSDAGH
jgi:hypothetical protein